MSNKLMKIMAIGYKRHGKDTFCEILRDKYGITFASSSETACHLFIFDKIKDVFGYKTHQECFEDRGNHRELWYNLICDYVKDDLSRLGKEIFANNDVYCGCRDDLEFNDMKANGLFDIAVWIDASDRKPPEDKVSMKLCIKDAGRVINNNGTLTDLEAEVDRFYEEVVAPFLKEKKRKETEFSIQMQISE